jgi:hypothetical protein
MMLTGESKKSILETRLRNNIVDVESSIQANLYQRIKLATVMTKDKQIEAEKIKNFQISHGMNVVVYEKFFRTFCIFDEKHNYMLKMSLKSLKKGLKYWYYGQKNDLMADLIFNFIGNGCQNYFVKFSEFLEFCWHFS